jgi:hypothetical protein
MLPRVCIIAFIFRKSANHVKMIGEDGFGFDIERISHLDDSKSLARKRDHGIFCEDLLTAKVTTVKKDLPPGTNVRR